jgi:hypothetical protein
LFCPSDAPCIERPPHPLSMLFFRFMGTNNSVVMY